MNHKYYYYYYYYYYYSNYLDNLYLIKSLTKSD